MNDLCTVCVKNRLYHTPLKGVKGSKGRLYQIFDTGFKVGKGRL